MKIPLACKTASYVACFSIAFASLWSLVWQSALATDDSTGLELIQVVQKQSEAWNRGDLKEFMSPYWNDERLTFSSSGKTQRGWKATFDNYKKNYPDRATMGKLTFTELETQELGAEAILMLGRWQLDRETPVGGNFSLVWKRIDGKWLIVHDHSSALRPCFGKHTELEISQSRKVRSALRIPMLRLRV